ncbi:MAG: Asp/Glu racemase [Litoreibacter sp.]|nr:Asp/Glu racemase [Litoreibacter sp.]
MTVFSYTLDETSDPSMGLIVLQSDETIEDDFRRLLPGSVTLHVSRVPSAPEVTRETLAQMEGHIRATADRLPGVTPYAVIGYGCTSGTAVIGQARIDELVKHGAPTGAVSEPVSALIAACGALGVTRLAFLSPYIAEVSQHLRDVLATNGIATPVFGSFNEAEEAKVSRIGRASLIEAALELAAEPEAEAIFMSCTNLCTLDVIDEIEQRSGKPVLSSNQVLAWHMCRLAGVATARGPFGKLLGTP